MDDRLFYRTGQRYRLLVLVCRGGRKMYQSVTMDEFERLVSQSNITVIDVREVAEFEKGHIQNAINVPLNSIKEQMTTLKDSSYYVICHSGGRSQVASQLLASSGYEIINVLGGMSAWKGTVSTEK